MRKTLILIGGLLLAVAVSAQTLRFERFVPALQQPWYFTNGVIGLVAGDDPVVDRADALDIVTEGGSFNLTVSGITTTGAIDRVVAVISSGSGCESSQLLTDMGGGIWTGLLPSITSESPRLTVAAFAIDTEGNVSLPVTHSVAGDILFRESFE